MSKPINRKNQKRQYQLFGLISWLAVLYVSFHHGYITLFPSGDSVPIIATLEHIVAAPFEIFPTEPKSVLMGAFIGLVGPLLIYAEYLKRRDLRPMVESGSAQWNEDLKGYNLIYAELAHWTIALTEGRVPKFIQTMLLAIDAFLSKIPLFSILHKKLSASLTKTFAKPDTRTGVKNMILSKDIFMSMNGRKTRRNNNQLVIGGSGAGKSRFLVKPNLLQANTSFVVTDPSGELLETQGAFLVDEGYEVRVFNLVEMGHSCCYNPFRYIRNDEGVLIMINALIKNTTPKGSSTNDPFWEKAETALLQACCFYLRAMCNPEEQNFSNVMKLLRCAEAAEGQEDKDSTLDIMFKELAEIDPEHIGVQSYAVFKSAGGGKTAQSILISCQTRLQTFNLDAIKKLTSTDNIDLGSIGDKKVALFCITPSADTTFNYLIALMYTQLYETLYFHAETECPGKRLPYHVRFLLDEFANIGTIPDFPQKLATMRKYEISCTIIIQALSQLKAMYKDGATRSAVKSCGA